jgi:hypothetical protein
MIPDPTYALSLLAGAFTQARAATQEGAKQRAFQQEQFEAQREEQRRLTAERRAQEWALAQRQRQTNLELQENQKVLDNWPLRLFPSQILKSHRTDGPTPLRVLLSMPATGPRDLEGPVRQALQQFVSTHYNFNLGVRPVELLHAHPQSPAERDPGDAQDPGAPDRRERADRRRADDVSGADLRPPHYRRARGGAVFGDH